MIQGWLSELHIYESKNPSGPIITDYNLLLSLHQAGPLFVFNIMTMLDDLL